jgi:acetyl-CoA carboxylase biotin carboxyl carrier protein
MDLSKIQKMLKLVAESDVAELEVEEDGYKLVIRKHAPSIVLQQPHGYYPPVAGPPYVPPAPPTTQAAPVDAGQGQNPGLAVPTVPAEEVDAAKESAPTNVETVDAPIVGTFYRASSPDDDPFVEVGSRVAPGDVLCIIEAMKIMNEIECEVSGVVKRILVENAAPVEFEQPLFEIEPSA